MSREGLLKAGYYEVNVETIGILSFLSNRVPISLKALLNAFEEI